MGGITLITNFPKGIKYIYSRSIATYRQKTGKDILEVRNEAYWRNGHFDKELNSLHFKENVRRQDLSDFWIIFDKIRNKEKKVYLVETGIKLN